MLSKDVRFRLFLDRLHAAAPTASHDEAFALIATTLNAIEDEDSGVPADPANWQFDGRMYPPQADMARPLPGMPGVIVYRSRAHRTFIGANGAFAITEVHDGSTLVKESGCGWR